MKDNKAVAVVLVLVIVVALAFVIYKVATGGQGGDVKDESGAPVSDTLELQPGAELPEAPTTPPPGDGG